MDGWMDVWTDGGYGVSGHWMPRGLKDRQLFKAKASQACIAKGKKDELGTRKKRVKVGELDATDTGDVGFRWKLRREMFGASTRGRRENKGGER